MPKKSCKVLMIMKAAKLGWAGPRVGLEQRKSRSEKSKDQEKGRSWAGNGEKLGMGRIGA